MEQENNYVIKFADDLYWGGSNLMMVSKLSQAKVYLKLPMAIKQAQDLLKRPWVKKTNLSSCKIIKVEIKENLEDCLLIE